MNDDFKYLIWSIILSTTAIVLSVISIVTELTQKI